MSLRRFYALSEKERDELRFGRSGSMSDVAFGHGMRAASWFVLLALLTVVSAGPWLIAFQLGAQGVERAVVESLIVVLLITVAMGAWHGLFLLASVAANLTPALRGSRRAARLLSSGWFDTVALIVVVALVVALRRSAG
ncbi:hypothetical protein ABZ807_15290 [Micromonospora sp. NPDC047548]|uniref:hypothetical protein n=1 Tax=Micromonospora sp. NPDC047548 TaxID=3155624 RepID=UPI0033DA4E7E